ncbi:GDSL esterase/lipase At5g45910-like [Miscanthus floridulus]|uniref:GDSL esterase/lipase At5g45910-like n=1 Tax=Miscanthus floridulus TaxID=154761 RepID=UPI00345A2A33
MSSSSSVRALVQSLFPLDGAVNHDGHHLPLFVVQVTELTDGVFLGFAYNHALSDGSDDTSSFGSCGKADPARRQALRGAGERAHGLLAHHPDAVRVPGPVGLRHRYGCLHEFNGLARYHNEQLRMQVQALRIRHPHTAIAFAGYHQPVLAFLTTPALFGFDGNTTLVVCCCAGAGGGRYNCSVAAGCGRPGAATACADPSAAVNWDGIHLTEKAYGDIAEAWLRGRRRSRPY